MPYTIERERVDSECEANGHCAYCGQPLADPLSPVMLEN